MTASFASGGTVHALPADLARRLGSGTALSTTWEGLTPLARNEWICWIEAAKKPETRERRLAGLVRQLHEGKRRPCCWAGCPHRDPRPDLLPGSFHEPGEDA